MKYYYQSCFLLFLYACQQDSARSSSNFRLKPQKSRNSTTAETEGLTSGQTLTTTSGNGGKTPQNTGSSGDGEIPVVPGGKQFSVAIAGDPCVLINRAKGDPARYGFCPDSNNQHITDTDEKATLDAIRKIVSPRLGNLNCTCKNQADLLKGVVKLSLRNAGIKDLSPLSAFPSVKLLDLSNNQITQDPIYLSNMHNLQLVVLRQNKLTSVDSLARMQSLTAIDVANNSLKNVDYLRNLANLKNLDISNNQVGSITAFIGSNVNINYTGNAGIVTEYAHTIINPGTDSCGMGSITGVCDAINSYNNFVKDAGLQGIAPPLPTESNQQSKGTGLEALDTAGAIVFDVCSGSVSAGQELGGQQGTGNCGLTGY